MRFPVLRTLTRVQLCRQRRGCAMPTSVKTNGLNYTRRCVFPVALLPQREYLQVLVAMHVMWNKCKLVHGDLSEYNILYCPAPPSAAPHFHPLTCRRPSPSLQLPSRPRRHHRCFPVSRARAPKCAFFPAPGCDQRQRNHHSPSQPSHRPLTSTLISTNSHPSSRLFSAATASAHCLCAACSNSFQISEAPQWMRGPCK